MKKINGKWKWIHKRNVKRKIEQIDGVVYINSKPFGGYGKLAQALGIKPYDDIELMIHGDAKQG